MTRSPDIDFRGGYPLNPSGREADGILLPAVGYLGGAFAGSARFPIVPSQPFQHPLGRNPNMLHSSNSFSVVGSHVPTMEPNRCPFPVTPLSEESRTI